MTEIKRQKVYIYKHEFFYYDDDWLRKWFVMHMKDNTTIDMIVDDLHFISNWSNDEND